jgi:hypothetical protein
VQAEYKLWDLWPANKKQWTARADGDRWCWSEQTAAIDVNAMLKTEFQLVGETNLSSHVFFWIATYSYASPAPLAPIPLWVLPSPLLARSHPTTILSLL